VDIDSSFAESTATLSLACENRGVVAVEKSSLQSRAVRSGGRHGRNHLILAGAVPHAHLPAATLMARELSLRAFSTN
jgi:hypothetical protein